MSLEFEAVVFTLYAYPKTIETAVELVKKKDKLEHNYVGGHNMGDGVQVNANLKLLSESSVDSKIKPSDIATLEFTLWKTHEVDTDRIRQRMTKELGQYLKDHGLNSDDFEYDFDYGYQLG